jgi:hypothetical protein
MAVKKIGTACRWVGCDAMSPAPASFSGGPGLDPILSKMVYPLLKRDSIYERIKKQTVSSELGYKLENKK